MITLEVSLDRCGAEISLNPDALGAIEPAEIESERSFSIH
jgi:hypothetical protein